MWSSKIFSKCHKILIFASHLPLIMFWPFIIFFSWYSTRFSSMSPSTVPHWRPFQIRSDSLWHGLLFLKNIEVWPFVSASGLHFVCGLEVTSQLSVWISYVSLQRVTVYESDKVQASGLLCFSEASLWGLLSCSTP